ncbi:MAG TPA: hypothetical protein ENK57_23625 [Polyangiaceae bacterium]|nr:hypothetical protein [Polyangiaceae bacterium]
MSDAAEDQGFDALYARYRALPEGTKAEIARGEIRTLPRPRPRHVRAASVLGIRLGGRFGWDAAMWVVRANHAADDVAHLEPFDAVPFDVGSLWRVPGD